MSFEHFIRFQDPSWYETNRTQLVNQVRGLPTLVAEPDHGSEFWLKDAAYGSPDLYDLRIVLANARPIVEVTSFSEAFWRDVAKLMSWIQSQTPAELTDDDGDVIGL